MAKADSSLKSDDSGFICERVKSRRLFSGLLLILLLFIFSILSIFTGSYDVSLTDFLSLFSGEASEITNHIFYSIRFPRMLSAIVIGSSMGVAGLIMQSVLENPLASPFTTGISQGAMFGAAFAIIFLGVADANVTGTEVWVNSNYMVAISAFLGSLITVGIIMFLASVINIKSESIILAGVAISSFFAAATMLLQYFGSDTEVAATVMWSFGDLSKSGYGEISMMLMVLVPAVVFFYFNSWNYTCLLWGDEVAKGLGINTTYFRVLSLAIASVLVSVPVAFVGIIGFVGLIAPHMIKLFIEGDNRFLIPYSALCGAILLLGADVLSRSVVSDVEIPVGIMTSLAGVPFFIYLLLKKHGRRG